ncbi:MAG TPA: alpha-1,4-glucan--maltose-1-phosphate maltosyltransferase [Methylomirabilota bacterium]|nr:alpha-1,4-glucan--maltose-1-phosphate maltosyltransferase [Methylomirabilota bacterium]
MKKPVSQPAKPRATRSSSGSRASRATAPANVQETGVLSPKDLRRTVVIEAVEPLVDGGRYPLKREVGATLPVSADIFKEGHDVLAAFVRYRPADEAAWREAPMQFVDNDRWAGTITLDANARWLYAIEAMPDPFRSWVADVAKRVAARQDVASELREGTALVRAAVARAGGEDERALSEWLREIESAEDQAAAVSLIQAEGLAAVMDRHLDRSDATWSPIYEVMVDRERARFAAWYEFFPRSGAGERHGTFETAEAQLERAAAMGFDVVYLPPIHPVGRQYRKGRNNSLTSQPGEPGSPWAIGGPEGGHDAINPELGTLADFDRFVARAQSLGLEVALDFAIQCSPDHPYVRQHPEWFFHRPDGTIKYAENPPKKYQDVYPVNFYGDDPLPLWQEMKRLVEFWIDHGVTTFRVDNPHTKPVRFWEWLIREVQAVHPETVFLAEAFTRPKMMKALAKSGFSQSYTYFTWRNEKHELQSYLTEITSPPVAEYFRGNLWPNTPDILHETLQHGGTPAFKMRLVLAATLSSLYGIYSGYELGENEPFAPGSEEYLNSEKYELKTRNWNAPGNLTGLITRINRIRREHRALQLYRNLAFYHSDDANVVWYGKMTPERDDAIFVAANMDPHRTHSAMVHLPIQELGIELDRPYRMHELLSDVAYEWRGAHGFVELDPARDLAQIFHVRRS